MPRFQFCDLVYKLELFEKNHFSFLTQNSKNIKKKMSITKTDEESSLHTAIGDNQQQQQPQQPQKPEVAQDPLSPQVKKK